MSLTTRIESIIPRLSHLKSEIAQQIKALHPKKVLVRNWGRMVQGARIMAFHVKRFAHGVSDQIPRLRISARRAVQVKAESALLGSRIKAKSKEGIALTPEHSQFLSQYKGFVIETREVGSEGEKVKQEFLVKVKASALDEADKAFEVKLKEYAKEKVKLDAKSKKTPEKVTLGEHEQVVRLEQELQQAEKTLAALRSWATELKYQELGGKFDTEAALRDAYRFHAKAEGIKRSNAGRLVDGVISNIADVTQERLDIDERIRQISEKYRHKVYKDIYKFLQGPEHETLVKAQRNRQIIKGTDKLHFTTARHSAFHSRLPGLDFYMSAAYERRDKEKEVIIDDLLRQAMRMMQEDWKLFAGSVQEDIGAIKIDGDKPGEGSFNADRMWEYHHLKSFQSTMKKLGELSQEDQTSKSKLAHFMATYGEDLGLGEHPGYNLDTLSAQARAKYRIERDFTTLRERYGELAEEEVPTAPYLNPFATSRTNSNPFDNPIITSSPLPPDFISPWNTDLQQENPEPLIHFDENAEFDKIMRRHEGPSFDDSPLVSRNKDTDQ